MYLTPEEVAAVLKVHRRTVHKWLRAGELEGVKFGHSWRVPRRAVELKAS